MPSLPNTLGVAATLFVACFAFWRVVLIVWMWREDAQGSETDAEEQPR